MATGLSMRLAGEASARGLDPDRLQQKFGLRTEGGNGGEALCMPFFREGEERHAKYRTSLKPGEGGGKQWQRAQDKGGCRMLYNEDALRRPELKGLPVIITEGEPDLWAADLAGFERVVGWPDGAPEVSIPLDADSPKYKPLEDAMAMGLFKPENLGGTDVPIIIAADGDNAGAVLLHDLSLRIGRGRCKWLTYPVLPERAQAHYGRQRCKDLGEVLEFYGAKGVQLTIERAQWVKVDGVYRMGELPPRPKPRVFDIQMPYLRNAFRMRLGDWSVCTGIPSHGKTAFVNDMINRVVLEYSTDDDPIVVAHASFEQEPQVDHRRNLRWWFNGKHPMKQTDRELAYADDWIDQHFRFLVPSEDDDVTLEWVLEKAAQAVVRDGAKIVVIDPWNEMDHTRLPGESVTDYTGRAIKAFRRFARAMGVHVMVVAHPTKMQQKPDGTFPRPSLYSISDSAHWYNKCDAGMVVHRLDAHRSLIAVDKTRYHDEIGSPGIFEAAFNAGERRFEVIGAYTPDEGEA
jgi:twinkle protein